MKIFKIMLNSVNDVKKFVSISNTYNIDVVIKSGRYIINGKSIMGLFSLDLSHELDVVVTGDESVVQRYLEDIKISFQQKMTYKVKIVVLALYF